MPNENGGAAPSSDFEIQNVGCFVCAFCFSFCFCLVIFSGGCGIERHELPPPLMGGLTEYLCVVERTAEGWADIIKYEVVGDNAPRAWVVWSKDFVSLEPKENRFLKYLPHGLITETLSISREEIKHLGLLEQLKKNQRTYLSHKCYGCGHTFTTRISRLGKFETGNPKPWMKDDFRGKVKGIGPNFYCDPCLNKHNTSGESLSLCVVLRAAMVSVAGRQKDGM